MNNHWQAAGRSGTDVRLRNVSRASSGAFRCEVVGTEPTFETDHMEANLTVLGRLALGSLWYQWVFMVQ